MAIKCQHSLPSHLILFCFFDLGVVRKNVTLTSESEWSLDRDRTTIINSVGIDSHPRIVIAMIKLESYRVLLLRSLGRDNSHIVNDTSSTN